MSGHSKNKNILLKKTKHILLKTCTHVLSLTKQNRKNTFYSRLALMSSYSQNKTGKTHFTQDLHSCLVTHKTKKQTKMFYWRLALMTSSIVRMLHWLHLPFLASLWIYMWWKLNFNQKGEIVWQVCNKRFDRADQLQRHLKLHPTSNLLSCNLCNFQATNVEALNNHLKESHTLQTYNTRSRFGPMEGDLRWAGMFRE